MMKLPFTLFTSLATVVLWAQSATEADLKTLSQKRMQWLIEKKVDSLSTIYDPACITVHGNGLVQSTAEQLSDISSGSLVYKKIDATVTAVKDFGHTAILLGKGSFSMTSNGRDVHYNMVYTEVYVQRAKTWRLISRQSTIVP